MLKTMTFRIASAVLLLSVLAGCNTPIVQTPAPTTNPLPTYQAVQTQAAQTVVAGLTQNAPSDTPVIPTDTPADTSTPAPTETPLDTFTPVPPTATATRTLAPWTVTPIPSATSAAWNCTVTSATPKSTDNVKLGSDFDGKWVVKNTGDDSWTTDAVDIKFISGTKFQTRGDQFDLKSNVDPDESYTVIVDMLAPKKSGTYYAQWAIVRGSRMICPLWLTIHVP